MTGLSSITWPSLGDGESASVTIYVKNIGNRSFRLSFNAKNFNPTSASNYISLIFEYNGTALPPGEVIPLTANLAIYDNPPVEVTDYTFDIVITATEDS